MEGAVGPATAQGARKPRARSSPLHRARTNPDPPAQPATLDQIRVSGHPPYTQPQDLIREFSKFGDVKVEVLQNKFAVLKYTSKEQAQEAVKASGKLTIYGEYLIVKPFIDSPQDNKPSPKQNKRIFARSKQKGIIIEPKHIDLSGDFFQQADRILASVRLTQEEATSVSALYGDVEKVLQAHWPGCVVVPFGSITTGLGIKTSDADCYVHVPQRFQHNCSNFVNKARRILESYPHMFAEILSIPRANTPIVKFFHIPTETNCDLSFKTPLGSQNSKLIAYLLHSDPRLIPISVLVKYWAKVHGLSGTGKLTNYALTMMIIFYLQQPPISMLPPIISLQRDPLCHLMVDYWKTGFMPNKELIPPSKNTSSMLELLKGFFKYYCEFNFEDLVICPYLGTAMKKQDFQDLNNLPEEFNLYKDNVINELVLPMRISSAICVQDPYEQSHNVASGITNRFAGDLKAFIKFAADAYEKDKSNNCENFLKTILLQQPKLASAKTPEFRVHLYPKVLANIANPEWITVLKEVMFTIFEKMLKLPLEQAPLEEKPNPQAKKSKERYVTTLVKPIWKRKQFNRLYTFMKIEFVDRHTRITEEIINVEKGNLDVKFYVTMTFVHNPRNLVVSIKQVEGISDGFKEFGKFFKAVVDNWALLLIKPHLKPIQNGPKRSIHGKASDPTLDTSNASDIGGENEGSNNASEDSIACDNETASDDDDDLVAHVNNGKCDITKDSSSDEE